MRRAYGISSLFSLLILLHCCLSEFALIRELLLRTHSDSSLLRGCVQARRECRPRCAQTVLDHHRQPPLAHATTASPCPKAADRLKRRLHSLLRLLRCPLPPIRHLQSNSQRTPFCLRLPTELLATVLQYALSDITEPFERQHARLFVLGRTCIAFARAAQAVDGDRIVPNGLRSINSVRKADEHRLRGVTKLAVASIKVRSVLSFTTFGSLMSR